MNNKLLGKILIAMGIISILTTIVDYYSITFPLNLGSKQWVFAITRSASEIAVMPALGMMFVFLGLHFAKEGKNENLFNNIAKGTGILSLLFAVVFAGASLLYAISSSGVGSNIVDNLKATNTKAKEQLAQIYEANKEKVDEKRFDEYLEKMDEQMMLKINQANSTMQRTTFRTMLNLLLFSVLHLLIFLEVFNMFEFIKYKVLRLKRKPVKE